MTKSQRILVGGDFHIPWHDRKATALWLDFLRQEQPDEVILLGDVVDLKCLSRFGDRMNDPQAERVEHDLAPTRAFLMRIRELAPETRIVYLFGNHERRPGKYLQKRAPELMGVTDLPGLLHLDELVDEVHPYGTLVRRGHLTFTHGTIIRKWSAYTAKAMLESVGRSVIFGHTHRGGSYYRTDGSGDTDGAWENFCLCQFDMPYLEGHPNWQHGWTMVYWTPQRFHVVPVPVVNYHYNWQGREVRYSPRKHGHLLQGIRHAAKTT